MYSYKDYLDLRMASGNVQIQFDEDGSLICSDLKCHKLTWCSHRSEVMGAGLDSNLIAPNMDIMLPVFPTRNVFVSVSIGPDEQVGHGSPYAGIQARWTPEIGSDFYFRLGMWNPGDSLNTFRYSVLEHALSRLNGNDTWKAKGRLKTKCPQSLHGPKDQDRMIRAAESGGMDRSILMWNLAMERSCTSCLDDTFGEDPMRETGMGDAEDFKTGRTMSSRFGTSGYIPF